MKPSKPYEEVQITPTLIWRWVREGDEYVMRISEMALEAHKAHIEAALAQPEHPDLRKAAELALDALLTCDVDYDYDENPYNTFDAEDVSEAIDALRQALAQPEFDTPESHIVQWSIPVDPNNFGEALSQPEQESKPIYVMGNYAGEGKVVNASFGLPKGAFEFAPYTGKSEASKIKHPLDKKADNARELGLDYEPDAVQPKE